MESRQPVDFPSRHGKREKQPCLSRCFPIWPGKVLRSPWKVRPLMSAMRRYEILLPLRFNDGEPVPDELIRRSRLTARSLQLDAGRDNIPS